MKKINFYLIKITVLLLASVFTYYLFNQYLYPQRVCSGEIAKSLIWTDDLTNEKKIIINEKKPYSISLVYKRGAIYLEDDRFPLYKEFNHVDNFAKKTESGYVGEYSQYALLGQKSLFKFKFNELTSMLYTENTAVGTHLYEKKWGKDSLKIEFIGSCARRFF